MVRVRVVVVRVVVGRVRVVVVRVRVMHFAWRDYIVMS